MSEQNPNQLVEEFWSEIAKQTLTDNKVQVSLVAPDQSKETLYFIIVSNGDGYTISRTNNSGEIIHSYRHNTIFHLLLKSLFSQGYTMYPSRVGHSDDARVL